MIRVAFLFLIVNVFSKSFKPGDPVDVLVNTVGPYKNVQERYKYWDKLPYCKPEKVQNVKEIQKGFAGDRPKQSGYEIKYTQSVEDEVLCKTKLGPNEVKTFYKAITE